MESGNAMPGERRIVALENGTAIDHIPPSHAWKVLELLHLPSQPIISVAVNVPSPKMGKKDIIYVEDLELTPRQIDKIALVAQHATVNIIRNGNVEKKQIIMPPEKVEGVLICFNPSCISNHEKIPSRFHMIQSPLRAKCHYCERIMEEKQIIENVS